MLDHYSAEKCPERRKYFQSLVRSAAVQSDHSVGPGVPLRSLYGPVYQAPGPVTAVGLCGGEVAAPREGFVQGCGDLGNLSA